jgi:hypothetical protein
MSGLFADLFPDEAANQERGDGPVSGAYLAPRGVGASAWGVEEKKRTQILRRYWLIGQTLDGMRVWDTRRAIAAMKSVDPSRELRLSGTGDMGVVALYASLFESGIPEVWLQNTPSSHTSGPQLLNVLKVMDVPQAAAMAAEKCKVTLTSDNPDEWKYATDVAKLNNRDTFRVNPK